MVIRRWVTILAATVTILGAAGAAALLLGGDDASNQATAPEGPEVDGGAPEGPEVPEWAGIDRFERRCERLDLEGARARVLYEASKEMTRGDSEAITAAVTLDQSLPADQVLRRTGAEEEPGIVVSCRVQARLSASKDEFDVDETGWVERSLLTTDTARWLWYVTPKLGGTNTIVLSLRPVMTVRGPDTATLASASAETSNVQQYETSVDVNVPLLERPQEAMARLAATLEVAEGLVKALTALVVALIALGAVLGIRRRKKKAASW